MKDELAVNAYEAHARVALESNDLPEFRQCLARLKQLYKAGVSHWPCRLISQTAAATEGLLSVAVVEEKVAVLLQGFSSGGGAADATCGCPWLWISVYEPQVHGSAAEFYAYGVLHSAALGTALLNQEIMQLPRNRLDEPALVHALAVVSAAR